MDMTSKERMLTAYHHGQPDRVPVCPEISFLIPAKLTGKPYWSVYLYEDPPLGEAYLATVQRFDMDGLYWYDKLEEIDCEGRPAWRYAIETGPEAHIRRWWADTPAGRLTKVEVFPKDDAPWLVEKPIKNLKRDFPALKQVMGEDSWQWKAELPNYERVGDWAIYELEIQTPIDWWFHQRQGGFTRVFYDLYDEADYMREEVFAFYYRYTLTKVRAMLQARPDAIWVGGSASSLSISSPTFYRQYDLPLIAEVTRLCREAGVASHQHTCGRSAALLAVNYEETDLDVMEPLEGPPGGDVDLAEAKQRYGDRFCLKGNLNTFQLMLNGTLDEIETAARWCLDAAAEGGGFVLSTGDQCARDTPEANIERLVETAHRYGRY